MADLRQSTQYAQYMKSIGWRMEKINDCYLYIRKIPLTPFSIIKVQRPKKIPFQKISQLAKKHRALTVYLEPSIINHQSLIINYGYQPSKSPFLPTKTIQINLNQSERKILAQMKKDARYSIRKAEKSVIRELRDKEIRNFYRAWKKAVSWNRWVPPLTSLKNLKKTFGRNALFLAINRPQYHGTYHGSEITAGTIILITDKTAYYYYAFTSKEGRKKLAQYFLVWEAIKLAKKRGCHFFDFEGVYDQRFPVQSWKGFSHFKKSFGGQTIEYPGCFIKYHLHL